MAGVAVHGQRHGVPAGRRALLLQKMCLSNNTSGHVNSVFGGNEKVVAGAELLRKLNKTDPRTRMHSTENQSKTLIIDLGQRQESAIPGNDLCRLLSSLILVDKSCQRLLSTTRVNNMRRREKT